MRKIENVTGCGRASGGKARQQHLSRNPFHSAGPTYLIDSEIESQTLMGGNVLSKQRGKKGEVRQ